MAPGRGRSPALKTYRQKRDFSVTPEPSGAASHEAAEGAARPRFVVQHHRARRVHYDFRLEVDSVLASWAMPRGPSLDPSVRSLAVHVEDHPIEYFDFEGVIPKGQYGGGDVIVWDRGTWALGGATDAGAAIASGEVHFDLFGEKLKGRFVLVHTRSDQAGRDQWLMLHKHDEYAVAGWKPDDYPRSVKSGRTNEEVASDPEYVWHSDLPAERAAVAVDREEAKNAKKTEDRQHQKRATRTRSGPKKRSALAGTAPSAAELRALEEMDAKGTWDVGGQKVELTNLDKILFPGRDGDDPLTKRDLVRYYARIAPVILPYLSDRPLNMHRYPNGVGKPGFWHKEIPKYAPDWIRRWRNAEADPGETEWYAVAENLPTLVWVANYAALELHAWTSKVEDVHRPTWAYIDIDPGPSTKFEDVVLMTRLFHTGLEHLGVFAMPKLTGQRGIHIWIPIEPRYSFDETRQWVETLSRAVGATIPDLVSWTWQKSDRKGLARLDYTQNAINKTLVAPYSVRPAAGAPVSVPITWEELEDPDLRSDRYTIRNVFDRLEKVGDPFDGLSDHAQQLPKL